VHACLDFKKCGVKRSESHCMMVSKSKPEHGMNFIHFIVIIILMY